MAESDGEECGLDAEKLPTTLAWSKGKGSMFNHAKNSATGIIQRCGRTEEWEPTGFLFFPWSPPLWGVSSPHLPLPVFSLPPPNQPWCVWRGPSWRQEGETQNLETYHKDGALPKVCSTDHDLDKLVIEWQPKKKDFRGPNVVKPGGHRKTEPISWLLKAFNLRLHPVGLQGWYSIV